jgi:hypothetical protein
MVRAPVGSSIEQAVQVSYKIISASNERSITRGFAVEKMDTKDYGRIVLGGGFASISASACLPVTTRR